MPTRFFKNRNSSTLRHRTVTLLPEVERLIDQTTANFLTNVKTTSHNANFSASLNLFVLARATQLLTETRKGIKLDQDWIEWINDLIDGRRQLTEQDHYEYGQILEKMAVEFNRHHRPPVRPV